MDVIGERQSANQFVLFEMTKRYLLFGCVWLELPIFFSAVMTSVVGAYQQIAGPLILHPEHNDPYGAFYLQVALFLFVSACLSNRHFHRLRQHSSG